MKICKSAFSQSEIEPDLLDSKFYIYLGAVKAGLYRLAEQVCYIPIPNDILHLKIKIHPSAQKSYEKRFK